jgi:thymidylate synthase (FAD)
MISGGYEQVPSSHFAAMNAAMLPVPLNPDTRYLIARSGLEGSSLSDETRYNLPVIQLLDPAAAARAQAAPTTPGPQHAANDTEPLRPGDTLAVLNAGFVEYMDVMGDDDSVADAARTSYTGGKTKQKNAGLIRYLLRHSHTTPFEMGELKFRLYLPIFVYRQLFRHRTASQLEPEVADCISNDTAFQSFSVQNEMSGRYVEMPDHYYLPELAAIQKQSLDNKQGRAGASFTDAERREVRARLEREIREMRGWYKNSLSVDLAKELARANLPLSQYTLLIWKIDLKNLLHFIALRIHPHAQYEVREYARALLAVVHAAFPVTAEAFDDFVLGGERLTRGELTALRGVMTDDHRRAALLSFCATTKNARERLEFAEKLGLTAADVPAA